MLNLYITFVDDMMELFGALYGHARASVAVKQSEVKVFDGLLIRVPCEFVVNERRLILV